MLYFMKNDQIYTTELIPELSDDYIYVITIALDLIDEEIQLLLPFLSKEEKERAYRFKFEKHQRRYIAARGSLRKILAGQLNLKPAEIDLIYSKTGKPLISEDQNKKNILFNLSHSHELAVIALTLNKQVGIDLEYLTDKKDLLGLAKRFFTNKEYEIIFSLAKDKQNEAFYRAWTRKEAYLKATGEGISGIEKIEVSVIEKEPPKILNTPSETGDWSLFNIQIPDNYIVSLAVKGHDLKVKQF